MTIGEAGKALAQDLFGIYEKREAHNIVKILLESVSGWKRYEIQLNKYIECPDQWLETMNEQVKRLQQNVPVQYVIGSADFMGLSFKVNESVLIPRPETEELVEWVLEEEKKINCKVLDIGAGTGCISIVLQSERPEWDVDALEIDANAIHIIRENQKWAKLHHIFTLDFLDESNWDTLPGYDVIVSNPPYIKEKERLEMHENVTSFEPSKALFVPNDDPLLFYRKILHFAHKKLNKNGHIYFEIHEDFSDEMIALCKRENYEAIIRKDLQGKDRMVKAKKNE